PFPDAEEKAFGVGHPLLDENDGIAPDISGDEQIRACHDEVVGTVEPRLIEGQVMTLEVGEGPSGELVTERRRFGQPEALQRFRVAIVVVGAEEAIALDQSLRDLMHLRRLVDRAADEQRAWVFHAVRSPPWLVARNRSSHTMQGRCHCDATHLQRWSNLRGKYLFGGGCPPRR